LSIHLAVLTLWAQDVSKTTHFYRDVIGLPLLTHHARQPHFDLGETVLVILQGQPVAVMNPVPERFPVAAFSVDDLDRAVVRLQSHGIELPWGVESDDRSRWVMFYDPGGNLVELVQYSSVISAKLLP
jgi:catechol-2,3-dioxygenase